MTDTYTLSDVAQRLNVSPHTVRKWRYAGKIPPPTEGLGGRLEWSDTDMGAMAFDGPRPAGYYDIAPPAKQGDSTHPLHIQFRSHRIAQPLQERTPPGESLSNTARWIVEEYLALMATLDNDPHLSINDLGYLLENQHETDIKRRQERQR